MSRLTQVHVNNAVIGRAEINSLIVSSMPSINKVGINIIANVSTGINSGTFYFDQYKIPDGYCVYGVLPTIGAATAATHSLTMGIQVGGVSTYIIPFVTSGAVTITDISAYDSGAPASVTVNFTSSAVVPNIYFSFIVKLT